MLLQYVECGPVDTRGYLIGDEQSGEGLVVDVPIEGADQLLHLIRAHSLQVKSIVLTHGHFDHVGEVKKLADALQARVHVGKADAEMVEEPGKRMLGLPFVVEGMTPHHLLEDGDILSCGRLNIRVIWARA